MAALYSDEVIQKIAKAARFEDPSCIEDMKQFLISVGHWFVDHKNDRHPGTSFATDRDQLKKISVLAGKLESLLLAMSEVSAKSLWHPFGDAARMVYPALQSSFITDFGLTVTKREYDNDTFEIQHLRPHQLMEAIHVLKQLAEEAASALPAKKGGQQQFEPRQNWIVSAQNFWIRHSKSAFDPRTPAFDFCYQAFERLDGSVTPQQIRSAMRAANKRFPPSKKRKPKVAQES